VYDSVSSISGTMVCHDRMFPEYIINIEFINESSLGVGGGKGGFFEETVADRPVVRGSYVDPLTGKVIRGPFIPGSSLKGALRSLAERIAISENMMPLVVKLFVDGEIKEFLCTGESLAEFFSELKRSVIYGDSVSDNIKKSGVVVDVCNINLDGIEEQVLACLRNPVVNLFGAPWFKGILRVSDGVPVSSEASISTRTRVAIDRITGSQMPGKLFTIEEVVPGVRWRVVLRVRGFDLGDSGLPVSRLLRLLLGYLVENGLEVGGMVTAGYGRLRVIDMNIKKISVVNNSIVVSELDPVEVGVRRA